MRKTEKYVLQAGCPSCHPTNSVRPPRVIPHTDVHYIGTAKLRFKSSKTRQNEPLVNNKELNFTRSGTAASRRSRTLPKSNPPFRTPRKIKVKVKVHTLDITLLRESPPQKRSGMARVLKGSHSFTCTPTRSSAIEMSHILCQPSRSWYSFTDPGGMEG